MKVLFCDDDTRRAKSFQRNMIGLAVDFATMPSEAIEKLGTQTYDVVFLDFDYDEQHLGYNGFGTDITSWIKKSLKGKTLFVIHSLNGEGRLLMNEDLRSVGLPSVIWPFAWDDMPKETVEKLYKDQFGELP